MHKLDKICISVEIRMGGAGGARDVGERGVVAVVRVGEGDEQIGQGGEDCLFTLE